jgi:hypothetical protein
MAESKWTKGQTMIWKTLDRKIKIDQHEPPINRGWIQLLIVQDTYLFRPSVGHMYLGVPPIKSGNHSITKYVLSVTIGTNNSITYK